MFARTWVIECIPRSGERGYSFKGVRDRGKTCLIPHAVRVCGIPVMGVYDRMSSGERILVTNSPLADQTWHEACDASRFIHSINHLIKETIMTISPQELATRQERGEVSELIDVRTPVEFREVHVAFARNEPLDRLASTAA